MKRTFATAGLIVFLSAMSLTSCKIQQVQEYVRTVTVTGNGQVKVASNQANITLSVITRNPDVVAAAQENADKMAAVRKAIRETGIPQSSITTANYSIYQESSYQNGRTTVPGQYSVSNQVNITMDSVSKAGSVIDAAIKAGANQLSDISYTVSSTDEAVKQARLLAIKQAEEKANTLVTSSGATLGRILSITEDSVPTPYMANAGLRSTVMQTQSTEITGGDYTVTVSVTATYEIQ